MTVTTAPPVTLEQLAEDLAECSSQLKAWAERRKDILSQLEALHSAGQAPEKFSHAGVTYSRQAGKVTYDYSAAPVVSAAKKELEEAQEIAKALGLAVAKAGNPTWRVSTARDA